MNVDLQAANKLINLYTSAKSRGIECSLSFTAVKKMLAAKRCYYTGEEFSDIVIRTIDRVDNKKGYTDGNCVACSLEINRLKGCLTNEQIIAIYKGVIKKIK